MAEPQLGLPQLQLLDGGLPKTLPHRHPLLLPHKVFEVLTAGLVTVIQKKLWILPPAWNTQGLAGHSSSSCHTSQATALTVPTGAHFKSCWHRGCANTLSTWSKMQLLKARLSF